jgi:hypothetical protein
MSDASIQCHHVTLSRKVEMNQLTPEEEEKILHSLPKGTFALLLVFAAIFVAAWAFLFFVRFMSHGPIQ